MGCVPHQKMVSSASSPPAKDEKTPQLPLHKLKCSSPVPFFQIFCNFPDPPLLERGLPAMQCLTQFIHTNINILLIKRFLYMKQILQLIFKTIEYELIQSWRRNHLKERTEICFSVCMHYFLQNLNYQVGKRWSLNFDSNMKRIRSS